MKVLIADDHEVVRQGVKQILTDGFERVEFGEAVDASQLLSRVWGENWDLLLLDISMPRRSGLDALVEIRKERPALPVLILSMFSEREYALRALRAGAVGYLTKQSLGHELIAAVKKVLAGGRYITPSLAELLAAGFAQGESKLPHELLSNREYEVMKLIAAGKSVKEIANELNLGEKTVFTYRGRLLEKLGLTGDVKVARYALEHGLVD